MAATFAEIRAGLAAALSTVGNCQPYMTDSPNPPMLQVMGVGEIEYDLAMARGLDLWTLAVQGYQSSQFDIGAQVALDLWLAPTGALSVKAAVLADHTLGGKVESARVTGCSGYRYYELPTGKVLGAEWTVEVFNPGD